MALSTLVMLGRLLASANGRTKMVSLLMARLDANSTIDAGTLQPPLQDPHIILVQVVCYLMTPRLVAIMRPR
jgi:hypothetical protein